MYGIPLKRVTQFKYLEHVISFDLKDDADIERERRALSVRANMIARRFARCTVPVKVTLFRAYCTSFYTSSLWINYTHKQYSVLRVQYHWDCLGLAAGQGCTPKRI
ncbi:jg4550 [Pararge aegeria aegeria]|uniref:Jg4550 protein n=1 Tax=Pararge aegeria aegeria TaxID=348720 RepID=A0A8S4RND2_9NEOP|nr:jg4550 [Pararge aegeria aegeria]